MRMLNFSIWTFSNPTWLLSRSPTGLLNYKTTYSCALPLTKLTLSDKLQDLPCCCSLLSPQTPRYHSRLQRDVNPNTRVTCGIEVKGHKDAHNGKICLLYSSLDHHHFGKIFLLLPSEEELLVVLSPLLLKLGKLQSGSGRCCWGCPSAAGGPGSGKGMKSPIYHLPHLLGTGPNLTSRAYLSNLIPALVLWFLDRPVFYVLCSNSLNSLQRAGHWDWDEM